MGRAGMNDASPAGRLLVLARCPLCDGASARTVADGGPSGFQWVRCECGLVYKRSEPAQGAKPQALGDAGSHYDPTYFERYARRRRRRIAKSRRQILDLLDVADPGPLLDVGCSLGYALEAADSLGIEAAGVDLSAHAVAACRRLGFDARTGTLESLPFDNASFTAVTMKHVFEHTPRPRAALAELKRVLRPRGAVFFAVPNAGYFKPALFPSRSRFFRGEAGRAHFVCWSPATLARLLESEGFAVAGVHPLLVHRRRPVSRRLAEIAALPLRVPARLLLAAFGLRKEFWLVAVRT